MVSGIILLFSRTGTTSGATAQCVLLWSRSVPRRTFGDDPKILLVQCLVKDRVSY
jgi:hypothetical protein